MHRCGVRQDRAPEEFDLGNQIGPDRHTSTEDGQIRAELGICTCVLNDSERDPDNQPFSRRSQTNLGCLRPPVAHRHHVLRPGLIPPHGSTQVEGNGSTESLFRIEGDLCSETSADIRHFHMDQRRVEAKNRRDGTLMGVGRLAPQPKVQPTIFTGRRQRTTGLERDSGDALVDDAGLDDDFGFSENAVVSVAPVVDHVGAELGEQERCVRVGAGFGC